MIEEKSKGEKALRPFPHAGVPLVLVAFLGLAACSSSPGLETDGERTRVPSATGTPYAHYMIGKPYVIRGRTYYPAEDLRYNDVGIASWYGSKFHGRRTANGETYDMNALTAAHPTLPMPTIVRVTNLSNNRSVVLRVNDRGPFVEDRIIDVSKRAAELLGFRDDGLTRVRVTLLREETLALKEGRPVRYVATRRARGRDENHRERAEDDRRAATPVAHREAEPAIRRNEEEEPRRTPPDRRVTERPLEEPRSADRGEPVRIAPAAVEPARIDSGNIFIQAGAYSDWRNANQVGARLSRYGRTRIETARIDGAVFYRVRVGPVSTAEQGDKLLANVVRLGYPDARVVVD